MQIHRNGQSLGIPYLEDFWHRRVRPAGAESGNDNGHLHWVNDNTLLSGLGLGLQETLLYLHSTRPTLEEFAQWILERNGGSIAQSLIDRLNDAIAGRLAGNEAAESGVDNLDPVLTADDLALWEQNGYVVLHHAVPAENCLAAAAAIYEFLDATVDDAGSWYSTPVGHTIWIPFLRHPALTANRRAPRIHAAFAQIWGRSDLWVNTDQCGFNPPERNNWKFPGPHLHWDMSLALPLSFGTQAILYLTDTDADQGAFQCVPGFHRKLEAWLNELPADADPRQQDLSPFAKPIPGQAGDLVIWHQALPHGSSPNRGSRPRVVQYLNLRPSRWDFNPVWT
jgi:hypothetical protein